MFDTFTPSDRNLRTRKPTTGGQPTKPLQYLEADFSKADGCTLYGGFSAEIAGVFIPTYTACRVGTAVGVRMIFPRGIVKSAAGTVEWTRELNPLAPETEPGLGVRLRELSPSLREILVRHATLHPPLFFESADSPHPLPTPRRSVGTTSRSPRGPASTGEMDTAPEYTTSFEGLLESIGAYLAQSPAEPPSEPVRALGPIRSAPHVPSGQGDRSANRASPPLEFDTVISAAAVGDPRGSRQFHGGFSSDDTGVKLFVATELFRPVGSRASLLIRIPDGRIVETTGTVRWVRRYNPTAATHLAPPGLGIRVDSDNEAIKVALSTFTGSDDVLLCEEYFGNRPVGERNSMN